MASMEEDEENFAEDECTIEFGEEEPPTRAASGIDSMGGPRFIEYPGEDFSKYLSESAAKITDHFNDDCKVAPVNGSGGTTRRRYIKNNINNANANANAKATVGRSRLRRPTSSSAPPPPTPTPVTDNTYLILDSDLEQTTSPTMALSPIIPPPESPPAHRRKSIDTIRERVGRIFTPGQTGRRGRSKSSERLGLQDFTFADSKIGSMMAAQREQDMQAAQRRNSADYSRETQSDLGVAGSNSWWDVGTLSSNRSLRIKNDKKSTVADLFRRQNKEEKLSSEPNLSVDKSGEDRRSLFGSISKAVAKSRNRRSSDAGLPSPTTPSTSATPANTTTTTTISTQALPARSSDPDVKSLGDGQGTRRASLLKWLKDGVASRTGEEASTTAKRKSDTSNNQTKVTSTPRYTRIYEEMNRMTNDFRQTTVDNPLP